MPNPRSRAITLSFSQTVTVLMEACAIPSDGRTAFEARVRQLQRLGVPKRSSTKARGRHDYGIAELAALATAARLMAAFMVPTLAARYVIERWNELAQFALAGADEALSTDYRARRPLRGGPIAVFEGNALADLGRRGRHDDRYVGELGRVILAQADATELQETTGGAGVIIDGRTFMPVLVTRFAELTMATDAELSLELDRLRFAEV